MAGVATADYDVNTFPLMLTLVLTGAPYYCPSVAPDFQGNDQAAEEFVDAWREHIAG